MGLKISGKVRRQGGILEATMLPTASLPINIKQIPNNHVIPTIISPIRLRDQQPTVGGNIRLAQEGLGEMSSIYAVTGDNVIASRI